MRILKFSCLAIMLALCVSLLCVSAFAASVVYVADGGSGEGTSDSAPVGDLMDALNALGTEGGTVVVCGPVEIWGNEKEQFIEPSHTGKVTITSVYGGVDYAKTSGACIDFYGNYYLTGETEFNNITLRCCTRDAEKTSYPYYGILGKANNLTIGDGIISETGEGCTTYLSIIGGSSATYKNRIANIVINSGTWQRVRGGANGVNKDKQGNVIPHENYDINITINGGTFKEKVVLASLPGSSSVTSSHNGDVRAVINGGTFTAGVYLASHHLDTDVYSGNSSLTVNGGVFYHKIALAYNELGTYNCTFDVILNGGDYRSLIAIDGGASLVGDITSSLDYGNDVLLEAEETEKISFTNYLRRGADPFMFYYDGFYYYTSTGAADVTLIKARNISDIKTAATQAILSPENYTDLWSPEIHYFSAEEIGEENAGWYMFVGAKEKGAEGTTASNQRQYVAKCLDGDNLLGRWGDPVTGEENVLRKMTFENGGYNDDELCGGSSPIRINGKVYLTFISEEGRGTSEFHQTVNITTFETPWNITGTPVEICRPDYDWEKHGYWHGANSDGVMTWWPQVVEGASAVYAPTGEVYLMYTGSGYWTTWYALGYLKLVGDNPLDKSSWQKNPDPVLQRVETLTEDSINGCGHGSYFKDRDGQMWVAYHGYVGVDTSSKRFAFVEPIYVTADGVSIGNGSGNPAPLDTVYTINPDRTPLSEKASGFNAIKLNAVSDLEKGVILNYGPVDGTASYIVRRDGNTGKLVYAGTDLTCVDTDATPGTHTYVIQAMTKGTILSTHTTSAVARNNLRFKDMSGDGDFGVADVLVVLRDFVNGNQNGAKLTEIIQMLKCM